MYQTNLNFRGYFLVSILFNCLAFFIVVFMSLELGSRRTEAVLRVQGSGRFGHPVSALYIFEGELVEAVHPERQTSWEFSNEFVW